MFHVDFRFSLSLRSVQDTQHYLPQWHARRRLQHHRPHQYRYVARKAGRLEVGLTVPPASLTTCVIEPCPFRNTVTASWTDTPGDFGTRIARSSTMSGPTLR